MIRGNYHEKPLAETLVVQAVSPTVLRPVCERWGGLADAVYTLEALEPETRTGTYRLSHVTEWMPPLPPQLRSFDEHTRLPMMDKHGYSAVLEAEQRQREWAEWDARIGSGG